MSMWWMSKMHVVTFLLALSTLLPPAAVGKRFAKNGRKGDGFTSEDGQFRVKPGAVEIITPGEFRDMHRTGLRMHAVRERFFKHLDEITGEHGHEYSKTKSAKRAESKSQPNDDKDVSQDAAVGEDGSLLDTSVERRMQDIGSHSELEKLNNTDEWWGGSKDKCRSSVALKKALDDRGMVYLADGDDNGHAYAACKTDPNTKIPVSCLDKDCQKEWCFVKEGCKICDNGKLGMFQFGECCKPMPEPSCPKPSTSGDAKAGTCTGESLKAQWREEGFWVSKMEKEDKVTLSCLLDKSKKFDVQCSGCPGGASWCWKDGRLGSCPKSYELNLNLATQCSEEARKDMERLYFRFSKSSTSGKHLWLTCRDNWGLSYKASCVSQECNGKPWCFVQKKCTSKSGYFNTACTEDKSIKFTGCIEKRVRVEAMDQVMVKAPFHAELKGLVYGTNTKELKANWLGTVKEVDIGEKGTITVDFKQQNEEGKIAPDLLDNFRKVDHYAAALGAKTFQEDKAFQAARYAASTPEGRIAYQDQATYREAYRANPVAIKEMLENPDKINLPKDFKDYCTIFSRGLSDWFAVGEVWTNAKKSHFLVIGYDFKSEETILKPFDEGEGNLTQAKGDTGYIHNGNFFLGLNTTSDYVKVSLRTASGQDVYTEDEGDGVYTSSVTPIDANTQFQLVPSEVPGMLLLATPQFYYVKLSAADTPKGARTLELIAPDGNKTAEGGGPTEGYGSGKDLATPFYVVLHEDGTLSLQTIDGLFVGVGTAEEAKLSAVEPRYDPAAHSFKFSMSLKLSEAAAEEDDDSPPSVTQATQISGQMCVQFDLDLGALSYGLFPGVIKTALLAEVFRIGPSKCWGWSGTLALEAQIGWCLGGIQSLCLRGGVHMETSIQVVEMPLASAAEDLMWQLPEGYDTTKCLSRDPFDLIRATIDSAWEFIRRNFLRNPFQDKYWGDPAVTAAAMARKEEAEGAVIEDYIALTKPPLALGGVDEAIQIFSKAGVDESIIVVQVKPALVKRYPAARIQIEVFEDAGAIDYSEILAPKLIAKELEFKYSMVGSMSKEIHVLLSLTVGGDARFTISASYQPETLQEGQKAEVKSVKQGAIVDLKSKNPDTLSLISLSGKLKESSVDACKGKHINYVNIAVKSSSNVVKQATWRGDMLNVEGDRAKFRHPWGISLQESLVLDKSSPAGGGDKPKLNIRLMTVEDLAKLVDKGIEADTEKKTCWSSIGALLCKSLTELSNEPSGRAVALFSRNLINQFLIDVFSSEASRKALATSEQRPALRKSFEGIVEMLPETIMTCAREALELNEEAEAVDGDEKGSGQGAETQKALDKILECATSKSTKTKIDNRVETVKRRYTFQWQTLPDKKISGDPTQSCSRLPKELFANTGSALADMKACQKACAEEAAQMVEKNRTGTLTDADGTKFCNTVMFEPLPANDKPGGTCSFYDCATFNKFDTKKGYSIIARMPVPIEGDESIPVPADVAIASAPTWILSDIFRALDEEAVRDLLDGMKAYFLAGTNDELAQQIKAAWTSVASSTKGRCSENSDTRPSFSGLDRGEAQGETVLEKIIKSCLFQENSFLTKEVVAQIQSPPARLEGGESLRIETKVEVSKSMLINYDVSTDGTIDTVNSSQKNSGWDQAHEYNMGGGCSAVVVATWMWKTHEAKGYMTRPEIVPVAQAFFATWDQFSSKLGPYSKQVLARLTPPEESLLDFLNKTYDHGVGRFLHRQLSKTEQDNLDISKGDLGEDDGVSNYPAALKQSEHTNEKGFSYNVGLSIANLFLRAVGDIQALFNLYFANHPDWDGKCDTLPSRFHIFYEGPTKDPTKWKMQEKSFEDSSRPDFESCSFPSHRTGETVGEKGDKLSEDDKKLFLDWHWIAGPARGDYRKKRAAFFKTTAPVHGTDHWAALEPGDVSGVMWPAIWCELAEEQWKVINMEAVRQSVYEHQGDVLENYAVNQDLFLNKKHEGLELDIAKVHEWMSEEILFCEKVFPQGKDKFQLFLQRHNESAGKVVADFDIVPKWKLVFADQKKVLEHVRKVVLPFLRAQISAFQAKKEADCQEGFLKDMLCWIMVDGDVTPQKPWRAPENDEWETRPAIRDVIDQCGNELFGKKTPCDVSNICLSQTSAGHGCKERKPTIYLVREIEKGGVDIRSLFKTNSDMRLDKDEVMSKLEKEVDAIENIADSLEATRSKEEAAVANMETLLKNFMEMSKLSSVDHRALSYMNLKRSATAWEIIVAGKTEKWVNIMDHMSKLLKKVTKSLDGEDQKEGIRLVELLEYAQAYTELSMALQKRQISEYGIQLGCLHEAMRPVQLGHEGMAPYLPVDRKPIETQLATLVGKLKGGGTSEVDNIEYYFDAACKVSVQNNFDMEVSDDSSHPRPECERVILSKAFLALMPSLAASIHQQYEDYLDMLVKLLKDPTISQVEAMMAKLKDFMQNVEDTVEFDFYQAFAYTKDGTLHGELWRSLAEALSTIRLTLDERKESRREHVRESVSNKAEFQNKRRLRAQSLSEEKRNAMVKEEIISNVAGCACQKSWGAWMRMDWSLPTLHSFEGCRPATDLNNAHQGKALGFKDEWLSWPGICRPKNAFSAVCKAEDWVSCDPNKNPEDSQKFLIWRVTDPTRSDWVTMPLFTVAFYASISMKSETGSICVPGFAATEYEASYAWSAASWKKYEDEFAHCFTVKLSPAGTRFAISRCRHTTTNALLGTESSYTEWKLTGQLYIVSTNNVWGSGDGNYVKSWFGGDHNGKFDDVSTVTETQQRTELKIEKKVYAVYSRCEVKEVPDDWNVHQCDWFDPDSYEGDEVHLRLVRKTFNEQVAVASPYLVYFGIACKIIMLIQMSQSIGALGESDEEPDHSQAGAAKMMTPLAMILWQGLISTGQIPQDWNIGAAASNIKSMIGDGGKYFYKPIQNQMDVILGFQTVWEHRVQVRPMTEVFEAMEASQMLTILNHAKSLGANMDGYWDRYAEEHTMDLSRFSVPVATKIITDYAYTVENGQLFAGDVRKLQEHLNKMFVGCSGVPGWYKVKSDRKIFPTWERNLKSWAKEPLPMNEEFLMVSYDGDWFRHIKEGIDEDLFVHKGLSREGAIVSTLTLAEASTRHFIQKPLFQAFLEAAPSSTLQCMAYNIEKVQGKEGAAAPKAQKLPQVAPATLTHPMANDTGYSPEFYGKFFKTNWKAIQGDLKEKGKESEFMKSFERPGTSISFNRFGSAAEEQSTNRFFFNAVLSAVNRLNLPFAVPGLANFEFWLGVRNNFDVRTLMNSLMARMNVGKYKNTPLKAHKQRIRQCMQCIQKGEAFCNRRSAADAMLRTGHTEDMDKCVPRTKEARHSCRNFMWNISTNVLLNSSGTSAFASQVCPCYDRFTGESISPDWVTSVERCEELRWSGEMEAPARAAGAGDWRDGFAAGAIAAEQTDFKRTPLKNKYNFDSSFDKRFKEQQEMREGGGCEKDFTCCEGMVKGEQRFRCMNTAQLKDAGSIWNKTRDMGSFGLLAGDECTHFKTPNEWKKAKDVFSCAPKAQTKGFEGTWHVINKEWTKKMTADDLAK